MGYEKLAIGQGDDHLMVEITSPSSLFAVTRKIAHMSDQSQWDIILTLVFHLHKHPFLFIQTNHVHLNL